MFDVAVIIPVYNAEKFIYKSVNSAVLNDYIEEIIVVNDGSTDNTLKILERLSKEHEKIKIFHHADAKNHGRSASRNLGILKATSKYIAFLDADDYFLPDRFRIDQEILMNDHTVEGVYNAIGAKFYREVSKTEKKRLAITTIKKEVPPENLFNMMSPMGKLGHFSGDGLTVRRSVFNKIGLFNEDLEVAEDTHMWLKMALKCKLVGGSLVDPVAMRGVHFDNVYKHFGREIYLANYKRMWEDLLLWSLNNQINKADIFNIWKKAYESGCNKNSKNARLYSWFRLIFKYPKLIKIKKVFKHLPIFYNTSSQNLEKIKINILTRTSGRPNGFKECHNSVLAQTYKNYRHIVSYDDSEDLEYLRKYKLELIPVSKSKFDGDSSILEDFKPYNLYCNKLLEEVEEGWILFLDDDNKLIKKDILQILSKHISKVDEDTILFFQTSYPDGSLIPERPYFLKKSIELFHIDTACFVFHSKYKDAAKWDQWRTADYRFVRDLAERIPKQQWIEITLTEKFNFGDLGRRNDIY